MLHKGMGIAVEREGRVLMTEYLGERLYIHSAFKGAGIGKRKAGFRPFLPAKF